MKTLFAVILFVASYCGSFAQSRNDDYTLVINFRPSNIPISQLIIKNTADSSYVKLTSQKDRKGYQINELESVKSSSLVSLSTFFKTYKFQIKDRTDTDEIETYVNEKGHKVTNYHLSIGLHGIVVKGSFKQKSSTKNFEFWEPRKNSPNTEVINMLFSLMENSLNNDATKLYVKNLKRYFNI